MHITEMSTIIRFKKSGSDRSKGLDDIQGFFLPQSLFLSLFAYRWEDNTGSSETISLQLLLQIDQACTHSLSIYVTKLSRNDPLNANHSGLGMEDLDQPSGSWPSSAFAVMQRPGGVESWWGEGLAGWDAALGFVGIWGPVDVGNHSSLKDK